MTKSVLFVCAANRGRSVASEYIFRKMLRERDERLASWVKVSSAGMFEEEDARWLKSFGLEPPEITFGKRPYRNLITVFQKMGIDISNHRSRKLTTDLVQEADLIIVSEEYPPYRKMAIVTSWPWARDKIFTFKEFVEAEAGGGYLATEDPEVRPLADEEFMDFSLEHHERYVAEIESNLSQKMDKFLSYLQPI